MLYETITGNNIQYTSYDNLEQSMNDTIQEFLTQNSNN